jgi:hypothetical protein
MPTTSRNWDRSPENEFDKRFHDLRDSGYTGPIDQDGYAVTTGPDADILRRMAEARGETVTW